MKNGWVKSYRRTLDNPIVCRDAEYLAVWMYLLWEATHTDKDDYFKGKRITLKAGQLITGRNKIAEHFKMNPSKVQRILKRFEIEQQIEQQTSNASRLITILNWGEYQGDEQQNEQRLNSERTTTEQQLNTIQECKKERIKEDKNKRVKNSFDLSFIQDDFKDLVVDFIDYRKQIKKAWKTEQAIKAFHNKLLKLSGGDFEKAKRLIEHAKNNEWQTVYEIKEEKKHDTNRRNFERTDHAAETL